MDYLACDIGASGGRHILGRKNEDGSIELREIYRFDNAYSMKNGQLCWDIEGLWQHVLRGLKEAGPYAPVSFGVDTWGVDFVLLDQEERLMGEAVAYRDERTQGMDARLESILPFERHFELAGIAKQAFNSVYQLMSLPADQLRRADSFLMIPDYLHFLLTGVKRNEYTNASTTALLDARTRTWSQEILSAAGLPSSLFSRAPAAAGGVLGRFHADIEAAIGYPCQVVLPATHDTASAFLAVPAKGGDSVFLSSGTWSLLGVELSAPLTDEASRQAGFTNEGAYQGAYRYLKNIMGLWIFQCIRKELGERYSFDRMAAMAQENAAFAGVFDANDGRFFAPKSMVDEIHRALQEQGQPLPEHDGELFACVYRSLALCYREAVKQLERLTNKRFTSLHIVGGGSRSDTLNQWTADALGIAVYAGPTEATALGNVMAQMIALGEFSDLQAARQAVADSFLVKTYWPQSKGELNNV